MSKHTVVTTGTEVDTSVLHVVEICCLFDTREAITGFHSDDSEKCIFRKKILSPDHHALVGGGE